MVTMPGQPIESYSPEGEEMTRAITAREPAPYKPEMGLQVKPKAADANIFGQNIDDPNRRLAQRAEPGRPDWKERFIGNVNNLYRYDGQGMADLKDIQDAAQERDVIINGQGGVYQQTAEDAQADAETLRERRREEIAAYENMPLSETPAEWSAAIAGNIYGMVTSPSSLIPVGKLTSIGSTGWRAIHPYISRMLDSSVSNAAMNAALNATIQAEEFGADVRDDVDWLSLGLDTSLGALFGVPFGALDGAAAARQPRARPAPPPVGQAPMAPRPQRAETPPPEGMGIPTPEQMQAEFSPAELSQAQVDLFGEVIGTRNMTPEQIAQVDDYLNGGRAGDIPQAEPETEGGLTNDVPPPEPKPDLSTDPAKVTGADSVPAVQIGGKYFTGESHADALEKAIDQFGINSPEIKAFEDAEDANAFIGVIRPKQGWIQGIVSGRQDGFVPGITGGKPEDLTAQIDAARAPDEAPPEAPAAAPVEAAPRQAPPPPLPIDRTERQFNPSDLKVDAKRFQFKEGGDEAGVTDRLKGVKKWDPIKSGVTLVWEDLNGDFYIADGHQRHGLASRLEKEGQEPKIRAVVLREADGVTSEDARAIAAAKNIAEGTGNAVDAAKILRSRPDMGVDLPPTSALVRDAQGLATLSDDAFGMVINKKVPAGYAAQVGRLAPDPKTHAELLGLLAKEQPDNAIEAESMIRDALEAPAVQSTMEDMFGSAEVTQILFKERAQVLSAAATAIRKDRAAFSTLVREEARLTGAGNKLATQSNAERATQDAEILATLQAQARRKGPIADALAAAAKRLNAGESRQIVVRDFLNDLRRSSAPTGADGGSPGAAGRPDQEGIAARLDPGPPAMRFTNNVSGTYYVARLQRKGDRSVRGRNAGNFEGISRHLAQMQGGRAGSDQFGDSIALYKIMAPPQNPVNYTGAARERGDVSDGIGAFRPDQGDDYGQGDAIYYSFGDKATFTEEFVGEVPMDRVDAELRVVDPEDGIGFDFVSYAKGAEAIRRTFKNEMGIDVPAAPFRAEDMAPIPEPAWKAERDEANQKYKGREFTRDGETWVVISASNDGVVASPKGKPEKADYIFASNFERQAPELLDIPDDGIAFSRRAPPPGPSLFDAPPQPKPSAMSPEVAGKVRELQDRTIRFASGMSRINDFESGGVMFGGLDTRGVGLDINEVSAASLPRIAQGILDWQTRIFVDSGAFGLFRRNMREQERYRADVADMFRAEGAAPPKLQDLDFEEIITRYEAIREAIFIANQVEEGYPAPVFVAPDVIGDQAASLRLLKQHAGDLQGFRENLIVPLQKGEKTLTQSYAEAREILGTDFIAGIPSNEKAITPAEFRAFIKEARPDRVHFLGAVAESKIEGRLQIMAEEGLEPSYLAADGNILRSALYGKPGEGTRDQQIRGVLSQDPAFQAELARDRAAELKAKIASARQPAPAQPGGLFETGADNRPQAVIPGAERIGDKRLAERRAAAPLKASRAQKQMDIGLFSDDADQQGFSFSAPRQPPVRSLADITNPVSGTAEQKFAQLIQLTEENEELVARIIARVDEELGTASKANRKAPEKILEKANRPSILEKKPWHDVEHLRDSFRFKTVLDDIRQLPRIGQILEEMGVGFVKVDTAKVLDPGIWGFRIAAFDLRMPNGQIVEYYTPVREIEAAKDAGHLIFEDWRNKDLSNLSTDEKLEFEAAIRESRALYQGAWDESLARTGASESDLRASLDSINASLGSRTEENSLVMASAVPGNPSDQAPSTDFVARNPPPNTTARPSNDLNTRSAISETSSQSSDGPGSPGAQRDTSTQDPLTQPGPWRDIDIMAVDEAGNAIQLNAGDAVDFMVTRINALRQLLECVNAG